MLDFLSTFQLPTRDVFKDPGGGSSSAARKSCWLDPKRTPGGGGSGPPELAGWGRPRKIPLKNFRKKFFAFPPQNLFFFSFQESWQAELDRKKIPKKMLKIGFFGKKNTSKKISQLRRELEKTLFAWGPRGVNRPEKAASWKKAAGWAGPPPPRGVPES